MKYFKSKALVFVLFLFFIVYVVFVPSAKSQDKKKTKEFNVELGRSGFKNINYVPGEIIVKYKEGKVNLKKIDGFAKLTNIKNKFSLENKEQFKKLNIELLKTKNPIEETINELKKDENIEYAEPNYIYKHAVINTNDTYKDYLWGLDNTSQRVNGITGTVDKDIDAPAAWGLSEGEGVIVAVIDSGVAYNHPDLINNMWDGSNCNDENGSYLGGCIHGYDFENNDKNPLPDTSSHGTHVAGIIAAEKNNSKGVIGVAPKVKIMAIKTSLMLTEIIKTIDFSIQNGAKVINASFGSDSYSQSMYDAIERFQVAGGIFVASAGNDATNNDGGTHNYPSDYTLDNIISVAATDQNDNLADFSNYGTVSVDIGAPGTNIYSTVPSETVALNESFDSVTTPNIPSGWEQSGNNTNWGTIDETPWLGSSWSKVLYVDLAYPYANNTDSVITSPTINLNVPGANIDFWTICDTEYINNGWADYLQLEYSSDGVNFAPADNPYYDGEIFRWDEPTFDYLKGESPLNSAGSSYFHYENISIPNQFLTANFKFRFRWVTNSTDNSYNGCLVDGIKISKLSDGSDEQYGFMQGTSMAAPHVAGVVALVWSANPTLSITQVKDNIFKSGDFSISLENRILTNKRINSYNSILGIVPIYRFWSERGKHHFYTSSETEKNYVIEHYPINVWKYEQTAYRAFDSQQQDTVALYRFWSDQYQGHFYTASEDEKNNVINNNPNWRYEQVAYYVYGTDYTGVSIPVYRFWSDNYNGHFYTSSETERNNVINNDPNWRYEGSVFKIPSN